MKKITALVYNDFRNILREPVLILAFLMPMGLAIGARWGIPWLRFHFTQYIDLGPHYMLITAFFILLTPQVLGMVTGFLLLDERDEQTMMTLMVTPLAKDGYILYRILIPIFVTLLYGLIIPRILGLVPIPRAALLPVVGLAAMEAPIIALFMGSFAANKVEGLTLAKAMSIFMIAPLAGYLLQSDWRYLAGIIPMYWPVNALVVQQYSISLYGWHIGAGLMSHGMVLYLFFRRFERRIS